MKARVIASLVFAALAISACSKDSPVAPPTPTPAPAAKYVDATTGDDGNAGTSAKPWATITHAVSTANEGVTIHVAPGTYDAVAGEVFPIMLKARQKLIGDVSEKGAGATETHIIGDGVYKLDQMDGAAVVGAEGARIAGFVIASATHPLFYVGVAVDSVVMEIDHNTFPAPTYAGIASNNGAGPNVHDNVFENADYGLFMDYSVKAHVHHNDLSVASTGIRAQNATDCLLEYNTVRTSQIGIDVVSLGDPIVVRNNTFTPASAFVYGAIVTCDKTVIIRNNTFMQGPALWVRFTATPDMGTATDPGGNDMTAITGTVIQHDGTLTATALGNALAQRTAPRRRHQDHQRRHADHGVVGD